MTESAQLNLITPPSRPVLTSQQAAEDAKVFAARQREAVYQLITGAAIEGVTQKEAQRELGIERASLCARFWELAGGNARTPFPVRIVATQRRRERCHVYLLVSPCT